MENVTQTNAKSNAESNAESPVTISMERDEALRIWREGKRNKEAVRKLAECNGLGGTWGAVEMAKWLKANGCDIDMRMFSCDLHRLKMDVPKPQEAEAEPAEDPDPEAPAEQEVEAEPERACELTKDEAYVVADLISSNLFDIIRNDSDIDSMQWLINIIKAYEKMCQVSGYEGVTG